MEKRYNVKSKSELFERLQTLGFEETRFSDKSITLTYFL